VGGGEKGRGGGGSEHGCKVVSPKQRELRPLCVFRANFRHTFLPGRAAHGYPLHLRSVPHRLAGAPGIMPTQQK
jgi:hypothetical protein